MRSEEGKNASIFSFTSTRWSSDVSIRLTGTVTLLLAQMRADDADCRSRCRLHGDDLGMRVAQLVTAPLDGE